MRFLPSIWLGGLLCLAASATLSAQSVVETDSIVFPGAPLSKTLAQPRLKSSLDQLIPHEVELNSPSPVELATLKSDSPLGKPYQTGFGRDLPELYSQGFKLSELDWIVLADGGQVAVLTVRSPEAAAIRLLVDLKDLPAGVELRFFDPKNAMVPAAPLSRVDALKAAQSFTPANTQAGMQITAPVWSPVIDGNQIGLEIYLPDGIDPEQVTISLPRLSHLVSNSINAVKSLSDLGRSGSCQVDVACDSTVPAVLIDSVAKIRFTDLNGLTGLCSGTLLNDTDTSTLIPYFYTANHCIGSQVSASSLELFWLFQRASCGGANPTSVVKQSSGARLLANGIELDYSLLQLNSAPPAGVGLAGWTTSPLHQNPVIGVHHPAGDIKKISRGNGLGTVAVPIFFSSNNPDFIEVRWNSGTTEGGSSGSGLWAENNGQLRLIGTLTGGSSFCSTPSAPDFYGRFDLAFPALEAFLDPENQSNNPARLLNISTNLHVDKTGAIAGFIVTGDQPQRFVVMGEDAGSLQDPVLKLNNLDTNALIAENDNWRTHSTAAEVSASLREPATALSAAFAVTLPPGQYIATLTGNQGQTGQGIVSVTQIGGGQNTHLLNISTNGMAGAEGAIAGFIVTGEGEKRFVIMAENAGSLADPVLTVTDLARTKTLASNDNWQTDVTANEVVTKLRAPASQNDAGLALSLPQGQYLAIMKGKNGSTGRGVVSVTEVPD